MGYLCTDVHKRTWLEPGGRSSSDLGQVCLLFTFPAPREICEAVSYKIWVIAWILVALAQALGLSRPGNRQRESEINCGTRALLFSGVHRAREQRMCSAAVCGGAHRGYKSERTI